MGYNSSRSYVHISMSAAGFAAVNVPLSVVGILINMFFVVCMIFPPQRAEQLKPLLKVLLGSLVGCNTAIHVCSCLIVFYVFVLRMGILDYIILTIISDLILNVVMYTMMTSVTCCHWMNMFYFCQIVPPQHPFLVWFKRNIRALIYTGLIFNAIFYVFGMIIVVTYEILRVKYYAAFHLSIEMEEILWVSVIVNQQIKVVNSWSRLVLFLLSVCGMMVLSFATVLYLWRHMKNLEESGVSSPRLQRQIKIIITGITVQAVLHFLCSDGILVDQLKVRYFDMLFDSKEFILYTLISLYTFGTTINMCVSQSLFRQEVIHVWQKIRHSISLFNCNTKLL